MVLLEKRGKIVPLFFIVLAAVIRLPLLGSSFHNLHHINEAHYTSIALNQLRGNNLFYQESYKGLEPTSPPFLPWLISFFFSIAGIDYMIARLPVFVTGVLSVPLFYLITKELVNKPTAIYSALCVSIIPGIVYFSRNIQTESVYFCFILCSMFCLLKNKQGAAWMFFGTSLLVKTSSIFALPGLLLLSGKKTKPVYLLLCLSPILFWGFLTASMNPVYASWYYAKRGSYSLFIGVVLECLLFIDHTTLLGFLVGMYGVGQIMSNKEFKKYLWVVVFSVPMYVLLFTHTAAWIGNGYYHYPVLYFWSVLIGHGFVCLRKESHIFWPLIIAFVLSCVLIYSIVYVPLHTSQQVWSL